MSSGNEAVVASPDPKRDEPNLDEAQLEEKDLQAHNPHHSNVLGDAHLMDDAFHGETREHEMGLWEAVKTHPMACFWAFLFCFTIVSEPMSLWKNGHVSKLMLVDLFRSWNRLTCS